jgi:hypothetical protein
MSSLASLGLCFRLVYYIALDWVDVEYIHRAMLCALHILCLLTPRYRDADRSRKARGVGFDA